LLGEGGVLPADEEFTAVCATTVDANNITMPNAKNKTIRFM